MTKFSYRVTHIRGRDVILIEDLKEGKSVTNDIENVVETICREKHIVDPENYIVLYQDSYDMWNGWSTKDNTFIGVDSLSIEVALENYLIAEARVA